MIFSPLQRARILINRLHGLLRGDTWFPHIPLALLLGLGGIWLLQSDFGANWKPFLDGLMQAHPVITPAMIPPLLIGVGMLVMAFGLLFRSRIAWIMAMLLAATAAVSLFFGHHVDGHLLLGYFILMLALLLASWRRFDHSSIAGSTLFAVTSMVMLLLYATFGTYYLGDQFKPQITDLVSALYFAMVTMSTVGYGDITPQTSEAKLFAISVIVLGLTVFATSLTAVIAPMVSRSLKRIVSHTGSGMKRENHFVVIGNSPLAINTSRELARRGQALTRVLRQTPEDIDEKVDIVIGDPGSVEVLRQAGADKAASVLAMLDDDSENAFVILAARELGGHARTVAAVNDAKHLARIKLVQPDVVIAPQILGGELAAMLLCGEQITSDYVLKRVFQQREDAPGGTTT
ncbi:MAG TPA: voltage-gated potassium channel protein [Rhodanobacteraceae bacterium]